MKAGTALLLLSLFCLLHPISAAACREGEPRPEISGEAAKGGQEDDLFAKRWVVQGRVVDDKGRGIEGVLVKANCGCGTLMQTGKTVTARDGSYTLRFGPGIGRVNEETGKSETALQAASIFALKEGFFEKNLNRQGDLCMAGSMPREENVWGAKPDRIVLPEKPFRLDFVMKPAAAVRGVVKDDKGRPVAGKPIWISGKELPPSSSVLAQTRTDRDGRFRFNDVPTGFSWHLVMNHLRPRTDETTRSFTLVQPGLHKVSLLCRPAGNGGPAGNDGPAGRPKSLLTLSKGPDLVPGKKKEKDIKK